MNDSSDGMGRASLWTSVVGLILPVTLAILATVFIPDSQQGRERRDFAYALCGVLFGVLELAAFVCGIFAWRTRSGKAGLVVSGLLLLAFSYCLWEYLRPRQKSMARGREGAGVFAGSMPERIDW